MTDVYQAGGMPSTARSFNDVQKELTEQTDRGAALVAAAYLDDALKEMLQKYFAGEQRTVDGAFKGNGLVASFSNRIALAYFLGLLTETERRDMNLIRRIRNDFAHVHESISFNEPPSSQRCLELEMRSVFENLGVSPDCLNPRQLFVTSSSFHVINLVLRATALNPLEVLTTSEINLRSFVEDLLSERR